LNARWTGILLAALAFAFAVLVAGCGGGGDETSVTTSSISKAEFVKKANKICSDGSKKMVAGITRYEIQHEGSKNAEATIKAGVVPALRGQLAQIRSLGAPPGDAPKVEAFLAGLQESIEAIEGGKPQTLEDLGAALELVHAPASAYGISACAYGV
jgi:hypothetical protein